MDTPLVMKGYTELSHRASLVPGGPWEYMREHDSGVRAMKVLPIVGGIAVTAIVFGVVKCVEDRRHRKLLREYEDNEFNYDEYEED